MSDRDAPEPGVKPTPQQWVHMFLSASDEQRLDWAERVLRNSDDAATCFITNHAGELRYLRAEIDALAATVQRVRQVAFRAEKLGEVLTSEDLYEVLDAAALDETVNQLRSNVAARRAARETEEGS